MSFLVLLLLLLLHPVVPYESCWGIKCPNYDGTYIDCDLAKNHCVNDTDTHHDKRDISPRAPDNITCTPHTDHDNNTRASNSTIIMCYFGCQYNDTTGNASCLSHSVVLAIINWSHVGVVLVATCLVVTLLTGIGRRFWDWIERDRRRNSPNQRTESGLDSIVEKDMPTRSGYP